MEMWCFISAQTHYIVHRKWSSPPDVVVEQPYTILAGVYPSRILQSTTIETLLKECLPVSNYQHFNKLQKCLTPEFSCLLVFILFLCLEQCVPCPPLTNSPALPALSHHTSHRLQQLLRGHSYQISVLFSGHLPVPNFFSFCHEYISYLWQFFARDICQNSSKPAACLLNSSAVDKSPV